MEDKAQNTPSQFQPPSRATEPLQHTNSLASAYVCKLECETCSCRDRDTYVVPLSVRERKENV